MNSTCCPRTRSCINFSVDHEFRRAMTESLDRDHGRWGTAGFVDTTGAPRPLQGSVTHRVSKLRQDLLLALQILFVGDESTVCQMFQFRKSLGGVPVWNTSRIPPFCR